MQKRKPINKISQKKVSISKDATKNPKKLIGLSEDENTLSYSLPLEVTKLIKKSKKNVNFKKKKNPLVFSDEEEDNYFPETLPKHLVPEMSSSRPVAKEKTLNLESKKTKLRHSASSAKSSLSKRIIKKPRAKSIDLSCTVWQTFKAKNSKNVAQLNRGVSPKSLPPINLFEKKKKSKQKFDIRTSKRLKKLSSE